MNAKAKQQPQKPMAADVQQLVARQLLSREQAEALRPQDRTYLVARLREGAPLKPSAVQAYAAQGEAVRDAAIAQNATPGGTLWGQIVERTQNNAQTVANEQARQREEDARIARMLEGRSDNVRAQVGGLKTASEVQKVLRDLDTQVENKTAIGRIRDQVPQKYRAEFDGFTKPEDASRRAGEIQENIKSDKERQEVSRVLGQLGVGVGAGVAGMGYDFAKNFGKDPNATVNTRSERLNSLVGDVRRIDPNAPNAKALYTDALRSAEAQRLGKVPLPWRSLGVALPFGTLAGINALSALTSDSETAKYPAVLGAIGEGVIAAKAGIDARNTIASRQALYSDNALATLESLKRIGAGGDPAMGVYDPAKFSAAPNAQAPQAQTTIDPATRSVNINAGDARPGAPVGSLYARQQNAFAGVQPQAGPQGDPIPREQTAAYRAEQEAKARANGQAPQAAQDPMEARRAAINEELRQRQAANEEFMRQRGLGPDGKPLSAQPAPQPQPQPQNPMRRGNYGGNLSVTYGNGGNAMSDMKPGVTASVDADKAAGRIQELEAENTKLRNAPPQERAVERIVQGQTPMARHPDLRQPGESAADYLSRRLGGGEDYTTLYKPQDLEAKAQSLERGRIDALRSQGIPVEEPFDSRVARLQSELNAERGKPRSDPNQIASLQAELDQMRSADQQRLSQQAEAERLRYDREAERNVSARAKSYGESGQSLEQTQRRFTERAEQKGFSSQVSPSDLTSKDSMAAASRRVNEPFAATERAAGRRVPGSRLLGLGPVIAVGGTLAAIDAYNSPSYGASADPDAVPRGMYDPSLRGTSGNWDRAFSVGRAVGKTAIDAVNPIALGEDIGNLIVAGIDQDGKPILVPSTQFGGNAMQAMNRDATNPQERADVYGEQARQARSQEESVYAQQQAAANRRASEADDQRQYERARRLGDAPYRPIGNEFINLRERQGLREDATASGLTINDLKAGSGANQGFMPMASPFIQELARLEAILSEEQRRATR